MHRAYYSSVLQHPVERVWELVRDFNNYPRYIDGVTDSLIEDGKDGDEVGAVRRFCYAGFWIRQRLTEHSDAERYFSYAGLEAFPFPSPGPNGTPAAIDYAGTLRLTPIVDDDRTFIEWFVDFDCPMSDVEPWSAELSKLIPQWIGSLRHVLCEARRASPR